MPPKRLLLLLLLMFVTGFAHADAMPKPYMHFRFSTSVRIDSIMVLESDTPQFKKQDTLKSRWRYTYIAVVDSNCNLIAHPYHTYQKLLLFSNGNTYQTNIFETQGHNPLFTVTQQNVTFTVTETTNFFFKGTLGAILRALIITLILELLVAFTLLYNNVNRKVAGYIALANCLSLPTAWLLFPIAIKIFPFALFLVTVFEILICIFEYRFLKRLLPEVPAGNLLNYVVIANIVSFLIGGLIFIISLLF